MELDRVSSDCGPDASIFQPTDSPAFYKLPDELLELIIDKMIEPYDITEDIGLMGDPWKQYLANARLASTRFASLQRLNRLLLHEIGLELTPSDVADLKAHDFSRLRLAVRKLTLIPALYSPAMTCSMFAEVMSRCDEGSQDQYDLNEEWLRYQTLSRATLELFESDELIRGLTQIMKALPGLEEVHARAFGESKERTDSKARAAVRSLLSLRYHYGKEFETQMCHELGVAVEKQVFPAVFHAMALAGVRPKALDLRHSEHNFFLWSGTDSWKGIDLSNVRQLKIDAYDEGVVHELLRATQGVNLEELEIRDIVEDLLTLPAPGRTLPPMPNLKALTLHHCYLNAKPFGSWLRSLTSLKAFNMTSTHVLRQRSLGGYYHPWKFIWDAIRYHPNRLHLDIHGVIANDGNELSLAVHTSWPENGEEVTQSEPLADGGERHIVYYSLTDYFDGAGGWDAQLIAWFGESSEDWDPDSDSEPEYHQTDVNE